ncbi:MAG: segregation/condensation protein A [Thermodesulfovibrionia bacterium]
MVDTKITETPHDSENDLHPSMSDETTDGIHFKLPIFEGPLDLLLHLIKENKIDIYDIPIALITKQYLEYLELMKELNLEIAGEFLVMAATLIHIKSRMLLPKEEHKEELIEDPRTELVERLIEYQRFKEASKMLRSREEVWRDIFHRRPPEKDDIETGFDTLIEADIFDLISAFRSLMERAPQEVIEITRQSLTVTDKINLIMERLEGEDSIRFEELFEGDNDRISLIVTFIALLEIMRLGLARAYQERRFGPIWIINPQRLKSTVTDVIYEVIQRG